jgi:hypothetical protein
VTYLVTPYIGNAAQAPQVTTADGTSLAVDGLINGTTYTFTVTAVNTAGGSPESAPSAAITPAPAIVVPAAPTGPTATAGDATATVSWIPGVGGGTADSYLVTPYIGSVAQATHATPDASTTLTINGLTNGSAYTFTVTAVNTAGNSPASAHSPAVTPLAPVALPARPTGVTAAATPQTATVHWTPGVGGGPVVTYLITPYIGSVAQATHVTTASSTSVAIIGLTNGVTYTFTVTAVNTTGNSPESAHSAPVTPAPIATVPIFISAASTTMTTGVAATFTVATTGSPIATITESGSLPSGIHFVSNHDGSATLSGTPGPNSNDTYRVTLKATNSAGSKSQTLTLVVARGLKFTSDNDETFTAGSAETFKVTTSGSPIGVMSESGPLPSGLYFVDNHNGTASLSGTAAIGTAGTYPLVLLATNANGTITQNFTLVVSQPPVITSGTSASFTTGASGSFTVTTSGTPTATLSENGGLPTGVHFVDNHNGTATLSGTPGPNAGGTKKITIRAANAGGSTTQAFTIAVTQVVLPKPPKFTSDSSVSFKRGSISTSQVTASGAPTPTLTESGTLPAGVSFVDLGNGIGEFVALQPNTKGSRSVTLKATNANGSTTQSVTVTIK